MRMRVAQHFKWYHEMTLDTASVAVVTWLYSNCSLQAILRDFIESWLNMLNGERKGKPGFSILVWVFMMYSPCMHVDLRHDMNSDIKYRSGWFCPLKYELCWSSIIEVHIYTRGCTLERPAQHSSLIACRKVLHEVYPLWVYCRLLPKH